MAQGMIPFLDLVTPHVEMEAELVEIFRDCIRQAHFIGGSMLEEFERDFAQFCDTKYCIGVANGTDAVRFALMASGVKSGDLVITVPNTFIATTEAISQAGGQPVFVDIDESTYNLDPAKLSRFLAEECHRDASGKLMHLGTEPPVTAIVPVHLYGQMADMDRILELADSYGLMVVEDPARRMARNIFRRKTSSWHQRGLDGPGGGLQLLSREKSGSLRRSRGGDYQRRGGGQARSACCAIMGRARSTITMWKATTAAWIRFRPAFCTPS